jgi:hypothetical protein
MHMPVSPKPTEAMLPTLTWLSLDAEPSVRDRSRTMPVAGSVCSQKKANDRRDRSSRKASASAGPARGGSGFGATGPRQAERARVAAIATVAHVVARVV